MYIHLLNKIVGSISIILNLIIFIPLTIEIIATGGGYQSWGIFLLPLTFSMHLFIITGIFAWLKPDSQNKKRVKTTLNSILILVGCMTLVLGTIISKVLSILFFALFGMTVYKKIRVEYILLIVNIIGSLLMILFKEVSLR